MKLISNKPLREFAALHPDADAPLQAWRRLIERGD
jgi:mRNA interferase HigB